MKVINAVNCIRCIHSKWNTIQRLATNHARETLKKELFIVWFHGFILLNLRTNQKIVLNPVHTKNIRFCQKNVWKFIGFEKFGIGETMSWNAWQNEKIFNYRNIHYDPLMMSQKDHPGSTHGWINNYRVLLLVYLAHGCLEKKLKWFEFPFHLPLYIEYDGCFVGASYYVLAGAEGSTQEAPKIIY